MNKTIDELEKEFEQKINSIVEAELNEYVWGDTVKHQHANALTPYASKAERWIKNQIRGNPEGKAPRANKTAPLPNQNDMQYSSITKKEQDRLRKQTDTSNKVRKNIAKTRQNLGVSQSGAPMKAASGGTTPTPIPKPTVTNPQKSTAATFPAPQQAPAQPAQPQMRQLPPPPRSVRKRQIPPYMAQKRVDPYNPGYKKSPR